MELRSALIQYTTTLIYKADIREVCRYTESQGNADPQNTCMGKYRS